jgi:hypothetical protein
LGISVSLVVKSFDTQRRNRAAAEGRQRAYRIAATEAAGRLCRQVGVSGTGVADAEAMLNRQRANVTVRVGRHVAGAQQVLFMFAGIIDAEALRAVMQQAHRLTHAVAGRWRVEVIASGLDEPLLRDFRATLRGMQRTGLPAQLALSPRLRPELRALIAHTAVLLS